MESRKDRANWQVVSKLSYCIRGADRAVRRDDLPLDTQVVFLWELIAGLVEKDP